MNDTKAVLVTGCTRGGTGYEYCKAFVERHGHVIATHIPSRVPDMSGLLAESYDNVETLGLDVSSDESAASAVESIVSKHGRVDVPLNNAGIGSVGPLAELPLDVARRAWEVNTLGQLRLIQKVVPHMAGRRGGTIVNVRSVVGRVPTPWAGSYSASEATVHAFSDTLRVELRPFGINVVLVVPGAIRWNFGNAAVEKLGQQDWKLYEEFKGAIEERGRASQSGKSTDAGSFARHVVKRVLRPNPPKRIVFGHVTALFALLSWAPVWMPDLFLLNLFGPN